MFAIYTEKPQFAANRVTEWIDLYYDVVEYNEETKAEAKAQGKKFAHLLEERVDEYGNIYYEYVSSIIMQ